jgi:hypothetical protein
MALIASLDKDPFNASLVADLEAALAESQITTNDLVQSGAANVAAAAAQVAVDETVKALGEVIGDAFSDTVEKEGGGSTGHDANSDNEQDHDPAEVPHHANRRRAASGKLVAALRAAKPGSTLDALLSEQAWRSAATFGEELSSRASLARFRGAVLDAVGGAQTPGAQKALLHIIYAGAGTSAEERHRAMLALLQVRHPEASTIMTVAKHADCDGRDEENELGIDSHVAEECRHALRVLGALIHRHDTAACVLAQGPCDRSFSPWKPLLANVAHNLKRRRERTAVATTSKEGQARRRLAIRAAAAADVADELSMVVCLGNAGASEHIETIRDIATLAGESDLRDAALDATRRMDDPQVAALLWGFVDHSTDRHAKLRALRVLLDRDSDHAAGNLILPSTHGAGNTHHRRLHDEHAFNDIIDAFAGEGRTHGDETEEVSKLLERHIKVHASRVEMHRATHQRARAKMETRGAKRGEGRKRPGMRWTQMARGGKGGHASGPHQSSTTHRANGRQLAHVSSDQKKKRQLGFVKSLSFDWSTGLNGELGFYEHKTIFELGNEQFGAEAYVTTDDIAYIALPLFGSLKFGVRINNEAVIRLWANVAMISINWDIFKAEYSYIKEQEISMGDFPLLPDGCPFDKKSGRRRLIGGQRVVGSIPSVSFGAVEGTINEAATSHQTNTATTTSKHRPRRLDEEASDDATEASTNAVYNQGDTYNIPDISAWTNVLSFRPNKAIQTALDDKSQYLQRIEDALEMVAVDYTAVKITALPMGMSAHDLLDTLRRGDNGKGAFPQLPEEAGTIHTANIGYGNTWEEGDPVTDSVATPEAGPSGFLGARISMKHELKCGKRRGDCDDGSMIVTDVVNQPDDYHFMLTTNNDDGDYNSVTGNREIGIKKVGGDTILYTRGAHRTTTQAIKDVDYEELSGGAGRRLQRRRLKMTRRSLLHGVVAPHDNDAPTKTSENDVSGGRRREMKVDDEDSQIKVESEDDPRDPVTLTEEAEEEGLGNGWVPGEAHLGGRFLHHVETCHSTSKHCNWTHYSNESHPVHGRRILKYDATIHKHVISLDRAKNVIAAINCMPDGTTKGALDIVLLPGAEVAGTTLELLKQSTIIVGDPSLWSCDLEGNGKRGQIMRRLAENPRIHSIAAPGGASHQTVLSLRTVPAVLTELFLRLDAHMEYHPVPNSPDDIETRRRLRARKSKRERERERKLLTVGPCSVSNFNENSYAAGLVCEWGPSISFNYNGPLDGCVKVDGVDTNDCSAEKDIPFGKIPGTERHVGLCQNCYFYAGVKIVWKMKIDVTRPFREGGDESGALMKMFTGLTAGINVNLDASISLAEDDGTVADTEFTLLEAPENFKWPSGRFQVGYVPVTWELSAKLKGSIESDAMLATGKIGLKASGRFEATIGTLYCSQGFIEAGSDCHSAAQWGVTPINKVAYSPPTMSGEIEPITFDSGQLLSTTEFRYGVDYTLTFWGLLPITLALRDKVGEETLILKLFCYYLDSN